MIIKNSGKGSLEKRKRNFVSNMCCIEATIVQIFCSTICGQCQNLSQTGHNSIADKFFCNIISIYCVLKPLYLEG